MADIHNHGVQPVFNAKFNDLINKPLGVFRSGQFFLKSMEAKSIMDTLVQDSAKLLVSFQNQNTVCSISFC